MSIARYIAALGAGASLTVALPAHAGTQLVAPEDLFKMTFVSSAVISHDGSRVAFVASKMNGPKNTYLTNIWIAEVGSGRVWQLSRGDSDGDPSWSPDGKWLAFDSGRGEKGQIYRIAVGGGEAERLTDLPTGAFGPQWSHDGSRILFQSVTIDKKLPAHIDFKAAGFTPKDEQRQTDVRVITTQHFQDNGQGETFNRHTHLWLMASDGKGQKALTTGNQWSEGGAVWSPDDKTIAFNAFHGTDPYLQRDDIYLISSAGGPARAIPLAPVGNDGPTWSHDGAGIFYAKTVGHDPSGYPALAYTALDGSGQRVVVPADTVAWGDAVITDMTEGGSGCGPLFDPLGRSFVADVSTPGTTALVKFDTQSGKSETIVGGDREILECSMSDDGSRLAFIASDATHLAEVYVTDVAGTTPRQLTETNNAYLASVHLSTPEAFTVKDRAGFTVRAWFMRPPNAVAGRRYPTILDIHGGPGTEFGNAFFHEFQFLAARGYNVVYADPRGSVGFGHPFQAALNKSWGDAMFEDESAVMDAVVARPDVDTSRLGLSGGSYGGYATLWMISHTHRFKAAIVERPATNMTTQWLTGDANIAWDANYSWGNPWDHFTENWKVSPAAYVANITTPVMLVHSDQDTRTPIGETLQIYSALKILGRPVTLVEFPRDNHDLSRTGEPIHRVERLHISADWFAKYLRP